MGVDIHMIERDVGGGLFGLKITRLRSLDLSNDGSIT